MEFLGQPHHAKIRRVCPRQREIHVLLHQLHAHNVARHEHEARGEEYPDVEGLEQVKKKLAEVRSSPSIVKCHFCREVDVDLDNDPHARMTIVCVVDHGEPIDPAQNGGISRRVVMHDFTPALALKLEYEGGGRPVRQLAPPDQGELIACRECREWLDGVIAEHEVADFHVSQAGLAPPDSFRK